VAQSAPGTLYSAKVSNSNSTSPSDANSTPQITIRASNPTTGQQLSSSEIPAKTVSNANTAVEATPKSTATDSGERLTGLTTLSDGTLVKTSVSSSQDGDVTRLVFTDPKTSKTTDTLKVSGFSNDNSTVESILATKNDTLLGIISLNEGVLPFDLGTIDRKTGKVSNSNAAGLPKLDSNRRYSNLTQAADGTIYATSLGREGATKLVRIDLTNKSVTTVVELSYNNNPLSNDLLSLTISPSGQFYALANPNYEATNSLFTVDTRTGVLSRVRELDAEQITFSRS
ncbi:hypothetical protein, partial [Aetokthonos hydrillicola]